MGKKRDGEPKSTAKAAGVKSTFVVGDEILMTSFGQGNEAVIEKRIDESGIKDIENNFAVERAEKAFNIKGRVEGKTDDPTHKAKKKAGDDMIHAKSALEEMYFGKTFDDNMHIQLIYNILDIKKILAVHTNNIAYALNNLFRSYSDDGEIVEDNGRDFIGCGAYNFGDGKKSFDGIYSSMLEKFKKPFEAFVGLDQLAYFGNAFYKKAQKNNSTQKKSNKEFEKRTNREIFYILAVANELRQACMHNNEFGEELKGWQRYTNLFALDSLLSSDAKDFLDGIVNEKMNSLSSFNTTNGKSNFMIIFDIFGANTLPLKESIAKEYYDFVIRKAYKNTGFSLKVLRENLLSGKFDFSEKKYDTVRNKINPMLDFIVYKYYGENSKYADELIAKLRTKTKNEEKEAIYREEAQKIAPYIQQKVGVLKRKIDRFLDLSRDKNGRDRDKKEYAKQALLREFVLDKNTSFKIRAAIDEIKIKGEDFSYLSKMIYVLTLLLDGKEINDLLTTLINKFDNIASLETVIFKQYKELKFVNEFSFFNVDKYIKNIDEYIKRNETNSIKYDCDIVRELKEINSFARMTDVADVKKTSYFDAAYLLGAKTNIDTEAFEKMVTSAIIDKEKMPKIPYRDKKTGKMLSKPDTGMRNFIISNVIKSRQFKYLVRYTNPKKISECAKNKKLIAFALNAIDEKQIDRYYQSCEGHTAPIEAEKKYLTDVIAGMNFDDAITDLNHKADQFDPQKVKKRTVVSLYLTILYQIAKNLIYVNSRYVIAFNCLERDKILHKIGTGNDDYFSLTTKFCDNGWINERYTGILRTNMQNSDIWSIIQFRNNVDHLEIVRNIHDNIDKVTGFTSYFELYHSLMQLTIAKQYEHVKDKDRVNLSGKTKCYLENAMQHNSYCKDFVKALCSPFGYNLPRFKNLSIDGLFDMHDKREDRKTGLDG